MGRRGWCWLHPPIGNIIGAESRSREEPPARETGLKSTSEVHRVCPVSSRSWPCHRSPRRTSSRGLLAQLPRERCARPVRLLPRCSFPDRHAYESGPSALRRSSSILGVTPDVVDTYFSPCYRARWSDRHPLSGHHQGES